MSGTAEIESFWNAYREAAGVEAEDYAVATLGDNPELAEKLIRLIEEGTKRATATLRRDFEGDDGLPTAGGLVVVVDAEGAPRLIWRTLEVRVGPLDSVDERFARDEGEGDRTRAWWLEAHRRYFGRQARREGFEMHDGIEVVFERFQVVWPPEAADAKPARRSSGG